MKILVITQYYSPEPGATSHRLSSFVDTMVKRGHQVTVICEFPNHPSGKLASEDKWRLFRIDKREKYRIIRTAVLTFPRKNNIKRMLFYISFAVSSFIAALVIRRHDVIFASSPPIFCTFTAMLAARIKRSKFVVDIRDVWPDMALEVEAVRNDRLLKYGGFIERKIYESARLILSTTRGFKELIDQRGGKGRTFVCYNGSFEDLLDYNCDKSNFKKELGWDNKTVVLYAGLIGIGQNLLDLLPEIGEMENRDLLFVFIGDGPQKEEFEEKIKQLNVPNVHSYDIMSMKELKPYLYASDLLLVILRESDFFRRVIPSKFFDYMAAGKPLITNVDGEMREIMEKNNTGIYFSLRQPGSFRQAVSYLSDKADLRLAMGENGKRLVKAEFLRSELTDQAVQMIEQIN